MANLEVVLSFVLKCTLCTGNYFLKFNLFIAGPYHFIVQLLAIYMICRISSKVLYDPLFF